MSIGGSVLNALDAAAGFGFSAMAMFVRMHRQWRPSPTITDATAVAFRRLRRRLGIKRIIAHGSYLTNLAADGPFRQLSIATTADELDRCGRLGIDALNLHGGSCDDVAAGMVRVAEALNAIVAASPHKRVKVLLETAAGQGSSLGWRLEDLAAMLKLLRPAGRFGVCIDTCHIFAAGYDIRTPAAYRRTMEHFDRTIGLRRLGAIHVNDSKRPLGSRVDRHEHIGQGLIGRRGFANIVNDPALADVPLILETPKETAPDGRHWDQINAQTLLKLRRCV